MLLFMDGEIKPQRASPGFSKCQLRLQPVSHSSQELAQHLQTRTDAAHTPSYTQNDTEHSPWARPRYCMSCQKNGNKKQRFPMQIAEFKYQPHCSLAKQSSSILYNKFKARCTHKDLLIPCTTKIHYKFFLKKPNLYGACASAWPAGGHAGVYTHTYMTRCLGVSPGSTSLEDAGQ